LSTIVRTDCSSSTRRIVALFTASVSVMGDLVGVRIRETSYPGYQLNRQKPPHESVDTRSKSGLGHYLRSMAHSLLGWKA
jgi:hypothetical protein